MQQEDRCNLVFIGITGPEMALYHKGTNVRRLSGTGGCTRGEWSSILKGCSYFTAEINEFRLGGMDESACNSGGMMAFALINRHWYLKGVVFAMIQKIAI